MKKIILGLFIFASFQLNAQLISAGIKAGANITNFTGGEFSNVTKKALVGFHAGGFLSIKLPAITLQPELLVSTGGAKLDSINSSKEYKLTYIALPVMVKFTKGTGVYFEVGPQVGFKISEDIGQSSINDFAKNLDLAVGAGLGIQSKMGLGVGARYMAGVSKVGDFTATSSMKPDFKNSTIQLGISYRF